MYFCRYVGPDVGPGARERAVAAAVRRPRRGGARAEERRGARGPGGPGGRGTGRESSVKIKWKFKKINFRVNENQMFFKAKKKCAQIFNFHQFTTI